MKNQTCCFTGHRDIPAKEHAKLEKRLEAEIINLINQGVTEFQAGGALGFDTMAALSVLKLKRQFAHIKLVLVLPCKEQTRKWEKSDIKIYDRTLAEADTVIYVSEHYYDGCMLKRNRHMVDNSSVCVCYLTGSGSGTAYTADYARRMGLRVVNIAQ